jgi:RimJ/RimL family protein N-acetyltransferase
MIWGVEAGNDEAIGACGLKNIVANMAEYWCYIGNRSWWGRGVGRQILEECEAKAKKIGITDLYMKASSCNDRSIGLYTKMGFVLDDEKSNSGIHYFIKSKI